MRVDLGRTLHMGINYVTLPMLAIDEQNYLSFRQALHRGGIEVNSSVRRKDRIVIRRDPPFPLEISLIVQSPQPEIGQILIVAPDPERTVKTFAGEVNAILEAFQHTRPASNRQILSCDVTLRFLYPSDSDHAFQEIWEKRLHQPKDALNILGSKVLGGGLRFVLPPQSDDPSPAQVELKIESFLRDSTKIYVETQFLWKEQNPLAASFSPQDRLMQADNYVKNQVHTFMMEAES